MKTLIQLKIEKRIEDKQEYYLATSNDIQGLVAQGNTIDEVLEIAQDLAKTLLALDQQEHPPREIPNHFDYPLILEV